MYLGTNQSLTRVNSSSYLVVLFLRYGMAVSDPFIYVPNAVGFAFGCVQSLLLLFFPSKPSLSVTGGGDVREVLIQSGDDDDSTGADGFGNEGANNGML